MPAPLFDQAHLQQLRALPMGVVVPGDLPEGFSIRSVQAEEDPDWGSSYRLVFQGPDGAELTVEGTTGGVGDIMRGQSRRKFDTPTLGRGVVEFYEADSQEPVDFHSHWLQAGPDTPFYGLSGKRLEPEPVLKIAEGLTPLD